MKKDTWLSDPSQFLCGEPGNEANTGASTLEAVTLPNYFSVCVTNSLGMRLHLSQYILVPTPREREEGEGVVCLKS